MVRRIASQVHQQAGRLLISGYLQREPVWYRAVLEHPPLPLPARKTVSRTEHDLPPSKQGPLKPYARRPLPIYYIEDDVRRQFFRDHPFQAWRPVSLVERGFVQDEHPIRGLAWTRLRQRGRNPSVEDAIRFVMNLYEHHHVPLTTAYNRAVAQFRALRSEYHVATSFAALEAEAHGAVFAKGEIERGQELEIKNLQTFDRVEEMDEGAIAARKRWKAIIERPDQQGGWTEGREYVWLWKQGIRPTYSPAATKPAVPLGDLDGLNDSELDQLPDPWPSPPST